MPFAKTAQHVHEWLTSQGLSVEAQEWESDEPFSLISWAVAEQWRIALGKDWSSANRKSSSIVNPNAKRVGVERSGAGWDEGAKFCIASAFVPLLGSLEQFELDVLKSLLYYRHPMGPLNSDKDWGDDPVELEVVTEEPEVKKGTDTDYYKRPAIWTWIKPRALDKDQRRMLFDRVFDIELCI